MAYSFAYNEALPLVDNVPLARTSYPYWHLARALAVDYGDVLSYLDSIKRSELTVWGHQANERLPQHTRAAIFRLQRELAERA